MRGFTMTLHPLLCTMRSLPTRVENNRWMSAYYNLTMRHCIYRRYENHAGKELSPGAYTNSVGYGIERCVRVDVPSGTGACTAEPSTKKQNRKKKEETKYMKMCYYPTINNKCRRSTTRNDDNQRRYFGLT